MIVKRLSGIFIWACIAALPLVWTSKPASAAPHCIFSWATPGAYIISGNFRGSEESAVIRLTRDCRIIIPLPGVFTGGRLTRAGRCLRFSFKVQGEKRVFTAHWCNSYGLVPWGDRTIRASVRPKPAPAEEWPKHQNFRSRFNQPQS